MVIKIMCCENFKYLLGSNKFMDKHIEHCFRGSIFQKPSREQIIFEKR